MHKAAAATGAVEITLPVAIVATAALSYPTYPPPSDPIYKPPLPPPSASDPRHGFRPRLPFFTYITRGSKKWDHPLWAGKSPTTVITHSVEEVILWLPRQV